MVSPFSTSRRGLRLHGVPLGAALLVAGATATATACSESDVSTQQDDSCSTLASECGSCTDSGAQQICNAAAASEDPNQCLAALDDAKVRAYCLGGGEAGAGDASGEAGGDAADTGPEPACGAQSTDGGMCACAQDCSPGCAVGGCGVDCMAGATCTPTCIGGKCNLVCESGSTCEASCAGGGCTVDCKPGSNCANSCSGGGCVFTCEDGAVCNDTCTGMGCIGP
jgi:hypothetical protein